MEQLVSQGVNPHLQRVLKSFQTQAMRSLQGPGQSAFPTLLTATDMAEFEAYRKALSKKLPTDKNIDFDPIHGPPPFPIQQMPVFTPVDVSKSEKSDTFLENERIACFVVGGEKRLCLPQILNTVLRDFSLQQINTVCDELHIFCSRCNPEQLHILKVTGILPLSAHSCGLVTKTDAERLCNALLHRSPEKSCDPSSPDSFKVYHECFGKCKGVFDPELYTLSDARCIKCLDCLGVFSPRKFVGHSHKALENRTCHWGFDSTNWRSYLLLAKDQEGKDKLQDVLERMKARFDTGNKYKRKQGADSDVSELKRSKSDDGASSTSSSISSWSDHGDIRGLSAFRPWSPGVHGLHKDEKSLPAPPAIMREGLSGIPPPFLHTGPPVLLNPDRVVPHSESSRYEKGFAPNVSLAPASHKKLDADEISDEEEDDVKIYAGRKKHVSGASEKSEGKEWEVLSESDSSTHPSDEDVAWLDNSNQNQSMLEIEIDMIRKALDGNVGESKQEKDNFLQDFCRIRSQTESKLNKAIQKRKSLKEELAALRNSSKEKISTVMEKYRQLEKEADRVRIESECRLEEAQENQDKLLKEIKRLQGHEESETNKIIQLNRELQARLQQYEMAFEQIKCDNIVMQDELHRLGINVPDLVSKQKFNGRYSLAKLQRSPQISPTGSVKKYLLQEDMMIKKEYDT